MSRSFTRPLAALIAAAAITVPAVAFAQTGAQTDAPPSYARPSYASDEDVVRGQVVAFDGGYGLQVRDEKGYIDTITLHQGTIINPTGLRLAPGMSVTVRGVNRGHVLDANQIDTPYTTYGALPAYPYVYVPAYGYGYAYGYGPTIAIGIGLGPAYGWGRGYVGWRGRWR